MFSRGHYSRYISYSTSYSHLIYHYTLYLTRYCTHKTVKNFCKQKDVYTWTYTHNTLDTYFTHIILHKLGITLNKPSTGSFKHTVNNA